MEKLILRDKKFIIRNFCEDDIYKPKKILLYINNMIDDSDAMITLRMQKTEEQEKKWLIDMLLLLRNSRMVMSVAEFDDQIIGGAEISFCSEQEKQIADFSISIIKNYRGYGLGSYLLLKVIDTAKKDLKPKPTAIRLNVFANNKRAISLYQKYGFNIVSRRLNRFEFNGRFIDEIIMLKSV